MSKGFDEKKHPRDETGKFTEGVGTKAEQEKLQQMGIAVKEKKQDSNLTNEEKRLQELTGEKVDRELTKEEKNLKKEKSEYFLKLEEKIKSLKPVVLELQGKKITIEFDKGTVEKNIHNKCNSNPAGFRYKKKNVDKWRDIIQGAQYKNNKLESGKRGKRHNNTEQWLYYKKVYKQGDTKIKATINIRKHKDGKYFVDELALILLPKKNKDK